MAGKLVFCPAALGRETIEGFFMDTVYFRMAGPN